MVCDHVMVLLSSGNRILEEVSGFLNLGKERFGNEGTECPEFGRVVKCLLCHGHHGLVGGV